MQIPARTQTMSAAELALLDAINQFRNAQGRAPWQADLELAQVARNHSQDMAALGRLSHDGFKRRAAATGSELCVENLLQGQVTPARAVQLWVQSSAHLDTLLDPAARYAGIGQVGRFVTMLACATPPVPVAGRESPGSATGQR